MTKPYQSYFALRVLTLAVLFLSLYRVSLSSVSYADEPTQCGGGSYAETLTVCDQGMNLPWKSTPNYTCNAVAQATVTAQAGVAAIANGACYDIGWNQTGWYVVEKWQSEAERIQLGCEKVTQVNVQWQCDCNAPTPTPTLEPSPNATPSATPNPTTRPDPECVVPTPTPTPTPTPSSSPQPEREIGGVLDDKDMDEGTGGANSSPVSLAPTGVSDQIALFAVNTLLVGAVIFGLNRRNA